MPFEGNGNEANNATDYSGYGNNGTVLEQTSWNRTGGKIGGAYEFDGNGDYISITDNPSVDLTHLTISAWVKLNDIKSYETFVGKGSAYAFTLDQNGDGYLRLYLDNGPTPTAETVEGILVDARRTRHCPRVHRDQESIREPFAGIKTLRPKLPRLKGFRCSGIT